MSGVLAPRRAGWRDSDLCVQLHPFPGGDRLGAAGAGIRGRRGRRPVARPARSVRHRVAQPARQLPPPFFLPSAYPLGTDEQGRDMLSAIMYGTRVSLLVGAASVAFALVVGVAVGSGCRLRRRLARWAVDARSRRAADVSLHPDGAADRRRDRRAGAARPARFRADLRHRLRDRHLPLAAVRPHRARLDPGRAQQGLCRGGAGHRHRPDRASCSATSCPTCWGRCW